MILILPKVSDNEYLSLFSFSNDFGVLAVVGLFVSPDTNNWFEFEMKIFVMELQSYRSDLLDYLSDKKCFQNLSGYMLHVLVVD